MSRNISSVILQIALALFLIVVGIRGILGIGNIFDGITNLFSGNTKTIIMYILAITELVTGVFLILQLFTGLILTDIILFIFMILWIVQIVLFIISTVGGSTNSLKTFLQFMYSLSHQLLVLGALISSNRKLR